MSDARGASVTSAWIDGELVPVHAAKVSAFDRAFRSGEGVFETFRAYGRFVFRARAHLERAAFGADVLGFDLPPLDGLEAGIQQVVDDNDLASAAVRLVATPGDIDPDSPFPGSPIGTPRVVVTVHPLAAGSPTTTAVTVPWGREVAHVKAVSYLASLLARRTAREQGAGEALLTDDAGRVLEASGANLFAVVQGTLVTPPVDGTILPGVTREVVLEVAEDLAIDVVERPLGLDELLHAQEVLLTATTREVVGLTSVDGTPIGGEGAGPVTRRLAGGYAEVVAREKAAHGRRLGA